MRNTVLACGLAALAGAAPALAQTWDDGDVFVGVSGGTYKVYDRDGTFKFDITDPLGSFTTGGAFRPDNGDLYTTFFGTGDVVVFQEPNVNIQVISQSAVGGAQPESIVFNGVNEFFVGHAGGDRQIKQWSSDGLTLIASFAPATGPRGTDWIDLAADQRTMYYTSEGSAVRRFDIVSNSQLPDFSTALSGAAYALRLLPPFDGSTGMLVADTNTIKRLDSTGAVVQTYDAPGQDDWFALNLVAVDTGAGIAVESFWSGSFDTGEFFRFNIDTGAVEVGPINTGTGPSTLFGIIVEGEVSGGQNNPPVCSFSTNDIDVPVGTPINVTLTGDDLDVIGGVRETVTIRNIGGLPAGATVTPSLPLTGPAPQVASFSWTPGGGQVGSYVLTFEVEDSRGRITPCDLRINVRDECFLFVSLQPGSRPLFGDPNDLFQVDPDGVFLIDGVLENTVRALPIPNDPNLQGFELFSQVVLVNSVVFPNDPVKVSNGLRTVLGSGTSTAYGTHSGLWLELREPAVLGGRFYPRFGMR